MRIVEPYEVYEHCRIDSDIEESVLNVYVDSAEETVLDIIDKNYEDLMEEYGKIPARVKEAVLVLVEHSYVNRAPASPQRLDLVPYRIDTMLKPLMRV